MAVRTALDMNRRPCPRRVAARDDRVVRLERLARRIAILWSSEPDVSPAVRSALLEALADLDSTVELLLLRSRSLHDADQAGDQLVIDCWRRFRHLRRQWTGATAAR